MTRFLLISAVVAMCICLAAASFGSEDHPVLSDDMIREINSKQSSWIASRNDRFEGVTVGEARGMMRANMQAYPRVSTKKLLSKAPESFDSRKQWPMCADRIGNILNQGQCGSCWAFGATESLSDRFCIATKGATNVQLAPESLVSCDVEGNNGCNGGIPHLAWDFMELKGVLTDDCYPYTAGNGNAPACSWTCQNSTEGADAKIYKAKVLSTHGHDSVASIQDAIASDGPVEGTMSVYQDFMSYSSGVYEHTTGQLLGGHAIKMIGWGTDSASGKDYWIINNSWGTSWGMDGVFWIVRGTNNCGIDTGAVAGMPAI